MIGPLALVALLSATPQAAPTRTDALPVGICINIGNTFEPPAEASWGGRPLADDDMAIIAKAGFRTVRLPVRWDTHAGPGPDFKIDKAYMNRIRTAVEQARAAGLNIILNSHHFEAIHKDPLGNAPQLAAMWRQIAAHFADMPREHVWFEIENEPHGQFNHKNLLAVLTPALKAIRESNPDRPVIIGGELWSGIDSLATLPLPDDPHIIPTFHYYDPFDFTHQGATWVNPTPPVGRNYGTADDALRLKRDVEKIRTYIARTGKTPFMGEVGAPTTTSLEQRVAYHRAVTAAFGPLDIGMCSWAYSNTYPFYDKERKQWLPGLRGAMGLPE